MRRTQRSIALSPLFSFILFLHYMVCSPHTVKASNVSTVFGLDNDLDLYDDHLKKITKRLSAKDALSLSLTSKTAQDFKALIIKYAIKSPMGTSTERKERVPSHPSAVSLTEGPSSISQAKHDTALNTEELSYNAQMNDLYAKLIDACKTFALSNELSSQHASLLLASHAPFLMEYVVVLKHFFGRDKYGGLDEKKESTGNHSTHALGGVYVKADDYLFDEVTNPLDFMMEKAVSLLSYHLFPQERLIASSTIATFNNLREVVLDDKRKPILGAGLIPGLVQISERVEGIRLDEVLKHVPSQGYDAWYRDHFSLSSYQSFVLLSLLIRPADYKADNIMLKKEKDEVYHLVGIDNDMAFADPLVEFHGATHVGVKNILYALPLMDEPFTEEVIQGIKGWNPALIVIQWLKDLDHYNQQYAPLFEGPFKERYNTIPLWIHTEGEEPYPPRFPLKLREGTAIKLYEDLNQIKRLIEEKDVSKEKQEPLTLHQAFQTIDPLLADYYRWLREEYKTILRDQGQGAEQAYKHASEELYKNKEEWKTIEELFTQNRLNQGLKDQLTSSKDSKAYLKERTQDLNGVLIQHLDTLELQALTPINRKQVLEEVFLSFPELIAQVQHSQWRNPYLVHEGLKHKEALFSLPLLKTLISKFPESLRMLDGAQGYAPLHYAIENKVDMPILEFLLKAGADVNQGTVLKNGRSLTPLDLACLKEDIYAFMLLAHNSATSLQNLRAAASLYTKGLPKAHQLGKMEEWKIAYAYLRQKSDELNWLLTLEEHFPQGWNHQESLPKTPTEIKGAFMGKRMLTPQMVAVILDEKGKFKKDPTLSGRAETTRYPKDNPLFYFKKYPELPACEYAATSFMRRLRMKHVPRSELLIFHDPQEGAYPVLLTEAIAGNPVYKVWDNDDNFKHLDPIHTGLLIIASMLLNPEDQKEDNFILSPDKRYLIPIDNDHVFLPGAIQVKGTFKVYPQLQTKSLAFCLEEMNKPFPSQIVNMITSINIDQFLQQWMQELCSLQNAYHMLPNQTAHLWDHKGVIFKLPLSSPYMEGLYRKFHLMQMLLTDSLANIPIRSSGESIIINPSDLLYKLEPYMGKHYTQTSFLPTLKQRFYAVTKGLYESNNNTAARLSVSSSRRLMEIINITNQELISKMMAFKTGPHAALEYLQTLQKGSRDSIFLVQKYLIEETTEKKQFSKEEEKQRRQQIFRTSIPYEVIEFPYSTALKLSHLQTFEFLNKGQFVTVADLRGCKNMREEELMAFQQVCPNLLYLNISGWGLQTLAHFSKLERNILGKVTTQEISTETPFNYLERLIAMQCPNLTSLDLFAPKLKSLEIGDNLNLTTLKLKVPQIRLLDVTNNNIEDASFETEDYATVKYKGLHLDISYIDYMINKRLELKQVNFKNILSTCLLISKLAEINKKFGAITSLTLDNCNFSVKSSDTLLQSTTLAKLKYLDIGGRRSADLISASYEGSKYLSQSTIFENLISITLSNSDIGIIGIKHLSQSSTLKNLLSLNLENNNIGPDGAKIISQTSTLINLISLNLRSNGIKDTGAIAISNSPSLINLTSLNLANNNIQDSAMELISKSSNLNNLNFLNLEHNNIGNEGASALIKSSYLTRLTKVILDDYKISSPMERLISNLWREDLYRKKILALHLLVDPDDNSLTIGQLLSSSPYLANFTLLYCNGKNKPQNDNIIYLASSPHIYNLDTLYLEEANIKSNYFSVLNRNNALTSINTIRLNNCIINRDNMASEDQCLAFTTLQSLLIENCKLSSTNIRGLCQYKPFLNITYLNLNHNKLDDISIWYLTESSTLTNLRAIDLQKNDIGSEGAMHLSQSSNSSNFTYLSLNDNSLGDVGIKYLSKSSNLINLSNLDLASNNIGSNGAIYLSQSNNFFHLTYLNLSHNSIGDIGIEYLSKSSTLLNLNAIFLENSNISNKGAKYLRQSNNFSNLTSLFLCTNHIQANGIYDVMNGKYSKLKQLHLCRNNLGDEDVKHITNSITFSNLTLLHLKGNKISKHGAEYISQSAILSNLAELNASDNDIGNEGAIAISKSQTLTNLTFLNLENNNFSDTAKQEFKESKTLTKLMDLKL